MKIDKVVETKEGSVRFQGELNPEEVGFMVEWFINSMVAAGALPFISTKDLSSVISEDNGIVQ